MSFVPLNSQIEQLVALLHRGYFREAEAYARDLIAAHPNFGYGWKVLALAMRRQGRNAIEEFRKAAKMLPKDHESQINLGNALIATGEHEEAMHCYRRALKLKPNDAQAHCGLGNAYMAVGAFEESELCQRRALEVQPDFVHAHYNLGNVLQKLGRLQEAESAYRRAIELEPRFAPAHYNLGNILHDLSRPAQAVESFRRALEIDPDNLDAYSNLLFTSLLYGLLSPTVMLAEARRFGKRAASRASPCTAWDNVPDPERILRIGLVSGDLRSHPVGFFIESVLGALTLRGAHRVEVHAYYNNERTDAVTERIKACCRGWTSSVGLSDEALAEKIREDRIDVLLDLSGHTALSRLPMFARKPAPIQVAWLGYLGTTGVAAMDYLIADPWTLLQSEEGYFIEKIWRLPETAFCFTVPREEVPVAALPASSKGHVTFGSFNNLNKIGDAVVSVWAQVLERTPNSRLFLKAKQLEEASVRQGIVGRFAAHGIDPSRLILKEYVSMRAEHLADYNLVDIALDPFPHPGVTTSVEALWMGVPVLTLSGERFLSRQGIGLLMNAGLPEWIAANADEYVGKSAAFAADLDCLATLRSGLRQRVLNSPLFDAQRFARHFEAALRAMWKRWLMDANRTG
ncbi:MAG TPA: tetratricopeptide repeat protein [Burkholderiales bacterium]|nr:tetratricopeptide repeat protein [Burkholderiales bacterium]